MTELEEINRKFRELHELTEKQDSLNLSIDPPNESIAIARDIINSANAIILEVSKYYGDLETLERYGYLEEKVRYLCHGWNSLAQDVTVTTGQYIPVMDCDMKPPKMMTKHMKGDIIPTQILNANTKEIYRGIRYNGEELEQK